MVENLCIGFNDKASDESCSISHNVAIDYIMKSPVTCTTSGGSNVTNSKERQGFSLRAIQGSLKSFVLRATWL